MNMFERWIDRRNAKKLAKKRQRLMLGYYNDSEKSGSKETAMGQYFAFVSVISPDLPPKNVMGAFGTATKDMTYYHRNLLIADLDSLARNEGYFNYKEMLHMMPWGKQSAILSIFASY